MSQSQRQTTNPETERYMKAVHNAALVAIIACPILALIPPRKLDFYTFGLMGVTGYSANYLIKESSGRSIWQLVSQQPAIQTQMQRIPERSVVSELQKEGRESWKVQRRKEIQEDVEEGKGFADMIMDQIWEVWNQGKRKDEEDE